MNAITVDLGERSYDVIVGTDLLTNVGANLPNDHEYATAVIVSDRNVDPIYGDIVQSGLSQRVKSVERFVVESGEHSKSPDSAVRLASRLATSLIRRNDLVVALGGGMIGDLGGFVASIYQRGMPVVQVPTSLLAQVDAAIGGKTGVNLPQGKNLIGTYHQPLVVICDVSALSTLPPREFRSGLAEVLKYGLCYEPILIDLLSDNAGDLNKVELLESIVSQCAAIKAKVVSEDEHDSDKRLILNYGHTIAHALESASDFSLLHGEAVCIGMMFAAALSNALGMLDEEGLLLHAHLARLLGLPISTDFDVDAMSRYWAIDKKNYGSQRWVLLEEVGKPTIVSDVDNGTISSAIDRVNELAEVAA